jgi:ADP-dependent NAD(P)H-hydrate dehydratase / NAD(P)H-hydrate epimerase
MSVPVISIAQMREWEKATWASGETEAQVIQLVGLRVARRAEQLSLADDLILLLAGKGHNGDDVRAAHEFLTGRRVELLEVKSPAEALPLLETALAQSPALIVDGLFGIGLNRPLDEAWIKFVTCINEAHLPVLAVDVPSGLNADTGETYGVAMQAVVTLTIGAPKQGLLHRNAWPFVGRLEVTPDVGLAPSPPESELRWTLPTSFKGFPPPRPVSGHKGTFGHLGIIAGSVGYHGAAVLATRGAQRAQPGLVTTFPVEPAYYQVAGQLQAAMVKAWSHDTHFHDDFSALLVGPGLAAKDVPGDLVISVRKLWRDSLLPMVVDASALDWLPMDHVPKSAIRVITPHPGEAARLLKTTPQQVQQDRVHAVREISRRYCNCWVVLKGHQTLIGRSTGEVFVNPSGNPYLAQGGSGDVLAGFLAGLLAQPTLQADVSRTLRYAAWQHGAAADVLQARTRNWLVEDLVREIGNTR